MSAKTLFPKPRNRLRPSWPDTIAHSPLLNVAAHALPLSPVVPTVNDEVSSATGLVSPNDSEASAMVISLSLIVPVKLAPNG